MPSLIKGGSRFFVIASIAFALVNLQGVAVAQVAPGVQQSAAQTATVTGTVRSSNGAPLSGAAVFLTGQGAVLRTNTDARGTFTFTSVPFGTYLVLVRSPGLGQASRSNVAISGDTQLAIQLTAAARQVGELRTIADVTTRSAGAHINVTAASIASVNPSQYAFVGNSSWRQLLDRIPGVTVGGNLEGGYTSSTVIPDSAFQPITLSINGAQPYETSATLDGMPLINQSRNNDPGSGVDLEFLPLAEFDAADVVRGPGANAPSIVDSIGGSFVLHPPGAVTANHFELSTSNDPYGGILANVRTQLRWGRLSTVLAYNVNNSPGPLGNQTTIPAYVSGIATINGQQLASGGFSQFVDPPGYGNCFCQPQTTLLAGSTPITSVWVQHSGAVSLSYNLPSIVAQVFYAGSSSRMYQPSLLEQGLFAPGPGYAGSIPAGPRRAYSPVGLALNRQSESLLEEKVTGYFGRSVVRVAALQNSSFSGETLPNPFPDGRYTLYGTAQVCPPGYILDNVTFSGSCGPAPNGPFTTPPSQATFNGTPAALTFSPNFQNGDLRSGNRDLLMSVAQQIGSASSAGISYVTSYYNNPVVTNFDFGGFVGSISQPPSVSETTNELRLNASSNISDKFSLDLSWYFAQGAYHVINPADATMTTFVDSIFSYNAPRLGATWRVDPNAVIRAAAGGGYALPPLFDLTGSNTAPFCQGTICTQTLVNLHLKPEQSFGWDVGTDIRLSHDTALAADLYRTNLYGQFFQSTTNTGTVNGFEFLTTQNQNLAQSRYEGVNFAIQHDPVTGFYWSAAAGLTRGYVVSVPPGFYNGVDVTGAPCTNCANNYILPGQNFNGAFQSTVPYANGTALLGYRWAERKYVDLAPTYYGNNNQYFQPAFLELDAHAGYPVTKNFSLIATLRNVTGIHGDKYQFFQPTFSVPTLPDSGPAPFGALIGLPYGPRSVIITANFAQ